MTATHFVNTDLDIEVPRDPSPLVAALSALGVEALNAPIPRDDGSWFVNFELVLVDATPETTVAGLLGAIEQLADEARDVWDACAVRALDLGFEHGTENTRYAAELSPTTIARAAAAGVALRVTIYPADGVS